MAKLGAIARLKRLQKGQIKKHRYENKFLAFLHGIQRNRSSVYSYSDSQPKSGALDQQVKIQQIPRTLSAF
ncbi:MAG: hypothetical protein DCF22_08860 [Leptolyngbya sp.]|nr:MAG: hypothetical protein DCF22_08860 [Leptolyngbya sp.]